MPSDRPKVTAYITDEASAALSAAADALGQSRSRLVSDLIDSAIPVLQVITDAALVVKSAPERQREAMDDLAQQIAPLSKQSEGLLGELLAIVGTRPAGPPPSNTGVRTP